jgi:hypothetical protein
MLNKVKILNDVNNHLTIALAEFNKIVGGSYAGSLREFKDLVSVKIKLERIAERINREAIRSLKKEK